jgi:hypothetical protein
MQCALGFGGGGSGRNGEALFFSPVPGQYPGNRLVRHYQQQGSHSFPENIGYGYERYLPEMCVLPEPGARGHDMNAA